MLETFKSKDVDLNHPSFAVFATFSDLTLFKDRIPAEYRDKVTLTKDTAEGDYNGMHLGVRVVDRIPNSRIVFRPMEGIPLDGTLYIDIDDTSSSTCKMKLTIEAQMNFLMKAMLGRKIQSALDQITDQLSQQSI